MEQAVNETQRVTAGFEIKYPNPEGVDYSHFSASVFVPLTVPDGADADDVEALANQALGIAKRAAAEQLGIETETTVTEAGVERVEVMLAKALGERPVREAPAPKKQGGGGVTFKGPSRGGGKGPSKETIGNVTVLNPIDAPIPDWVESRFNELVEEGKIDADDNEVWDNRKFHPHFGGNGKNENAPYFKTSGAGVALDFGGTWRD